jgi:transcriptional regulator with XRE-family HTH domain
MDSVFAENLKKYRTQKGISQEEMVKKIFCKNK